MELFDNLASFGLSTGLLQVAIVLGIAAWIVGMYWRFFAIGLGVLFCVTVLAMPSKVNKQIKEEPAKQVEAKTPQVEEIKIPEKVPNSGQKQITEEEMFLSDCVMYGGLSLDECQGLWADRVNGVEPVRLTKKWKKEYMQKVKHGRI